METGKVFFIGAGPGDPELLTVKGHRLLSEADIVIYAGSLINPGVLAGCRAEARLYDSAGMTLPEVVEVMAGATAAGLTVARVHSGDPSIYGAIREQMTALNERNIAFEVVPGVSSFCGAAAAVQAEYTLPGISQTVILTRRGGRTPVPERENLVNLARHRASMAIFLSAGMMEEVVSDLLQGYETTTPVAVVYRATWPDQAVIRGTLADIARRVEAAGIGRTALILVGDFLGDAFEKSLLYDENFEHGYRRARKENGGGD